MIARPFSCPIGWFDRRTGSGLRFVRAEGFCHPSGNIIVPLTGRGVPPFQENTMFTKSQVNPAPACVLLGGPKAIESTQEVCVLLRSPNTPHQAHPSWQQIKRALPICPANRRAWGVTDKLRFFLFG
jgi:hypothetical protein